MTGSTDRISFTLALFTLACWMLLFSAGHDVWHDAGRPDVLARLHDQGATLFDLRGAVYAFYGLLPLLVAQVVVAWLGLVRRR
jgi:hypothetical protein